MIEKEVIPEVNSLPVDQELLQKKHVPESESIDRIIQKLFIVNSRRDERVVALCLLYALDSSNYEISVKDLVSNISFWFDVVLEDNSYSISIVNGVIKEQDVLTELIIPLLKSWKLERIGCITRIILFMAIWELQKEDSIVSIVINEAVELAKMFAEDDAYKFVNGMLDEFCKKCGKKDENRKSKEV